MTELDAADSALTELDGASGATVAGVRCGAWAIPQPWAVFARPVEPPSPDAMAEIADWLSARADRWTVKVNARDAAAPALRALEQWNVLPAYVLDGPVRVPPPVPGLVIAPVRDPADFLKVYGDDLAPLVTPVQLADPRQHFLIATLGGEPVACAQVRVTPEHAYVSAVTVDRAHRRRGIGAAISAAASGLASRHAPTVWLHAAEGAASIYKRLGYRHVEDHVQLIGP